jgi:(p)ppGpp synthase/HD superfamily hydrolase
MSNYAQTNVQLFSQLQRDGFRGAELRLIADAYLLAAGLFTTRCEPSGKCFLAHVVGTASILSAHAAPAELVAAGLLHNVYRNGDFGGYRRGITAAKRGCIRNTIGQTAERYVYEFATWRWNATGLYAMHDRLPAMGELERRVVLLYLADQLEKQLGLEILYRWDFDRQRRHYQRFGPLLVDTARQLGCPALAQELGQAFRATLTATVPMALRSRDRHCFSYLRIPASSRSKRTIPGLLAVPRAIRRMLRKAQQRRLRRAAAGG